MYTFIALVLIALVATHPIRKSLKRKAEDEAINQRIEAKDKFFWGMLEHGSDKERDRLVIEFVDHRNEIVQEYKEDLEFIFGKCWDTVLEMYPFRAARDTRRYKEGEVFESPWQILFHIYCAKSHGFFVWQEYRVYAFGIDGDIIITENQARRTCAVIEKYIVQHYGQQYLLFRDPLLVGRLKWNTPSDLQHGPRPW